MAKALFLDRDGVVNQEVGYLWKPEQVRFLPEIFDLCRAAQAAGYLIIIITNQAGIARGFYSEQDFHGLMEWMKAEFLREGVSLTAYYYCPHHPEHGIGQYRVNCPDRKPLPGMLLRASRDLDIDLKRSVLVGDRRTDILAGDAAGLGTLILFEETGSKRAEKEGCKAPIPRRVQHLNDIRGFLSP